MNSSNWYCTCTVQCFDFFKFSEVWVALFTLAFQNTGPMNTPETALRFELDSVRFATFVLWAQCVVKDSIPEYLRFREKRLSVHICVHSRPISQLEKFLARIFKLLRSPRIDSNESIPPAYVALRAGTKTLFLLGSYSFHGLFKNSSTDSAQDTMLCQFLKNREQNV
jgi:hypothetical protein